MNQRLPALRELHQGSPGKRKLATIHRLPGGHRALDELEKRFRL